MGGVYVWASRPLISDSGGFWFDSLTPESLMTQRTEQDDESKCISFILAIGQRRHWAGSRLRVRRGMHN